MRKVAMLVLFFVLSAFVLPVSIFFIMDIQDNPDTTKSEKKNVNNYEVSVFFSKDNSTKKVNLEDYLCGVVAAEMPASFEKEALKAQAVAARSYVMYRKNNPGAEHPDAVVCTDFAHCKAYKNEEELQKLWGNNFEEYRAKVRDAVSETVGEVITYGGEVALAVFHSQSGGGRTENSADVWGGNVPYLVSVESHGEEYAPDFYSFAEFTFDEFSGRIKEKYPEINITSPKAIGETVNSEGGSVKYIKISDKKISGKDMRNIFNLRSSCFKVIADNKKVRFEVTGYGHGVGMSQYGANTMAKEGYNYQQILTHYYSGTKIEGV